jgi:hypothetical protein
LDHGWRQVIVQRIFADCHVVGCRIIR